MVQDALHAVGCVPPAGMCVATMCCKCIKEQGCAHVNASGVAAKSCPARTLGVALMCGQPGTPQGFLDALARDVDRQASPTQRQQQLTSSDATYACMGPLKLLRTHLFPCSHASLISCSASTFLACSSNGASLKPQRSRTTDSSSCWLTVGMALSPAVCCCFTTCMVGQADKGTVFEGGGGAAAADQKQLVVLAACWLL